MQPEKTCCTWFSRADIRRERTLPLKGYSKGIGHEKKDYLNSDVLHLRSSAIRRLRNSLAAFGIRVQSFCTSINRYFCLSRRIPFAANCSFDNENTMLLLMLFATTLENDHNEVRDPAATSTHIASSCLYKIDLGLDRVVEGWKRK